MRTVVYAPPGRRARHYQQRCVAWCEQHGHQVAGLTSSTAAVEEMLSREGAEVAVVARDAHGRQLPEVPVIRIPRWRGYGVLLPASAAPAGWLAARARDHPALTAGLAAAAAAGLVALPLIAPDPGPDPDPDPRLPADPPAAAPAMPPAGPATGGPTTPQSPAPSRPAAPLAASSGRAGSPSSAPSPLPGSLLPALPRLSGWPVPTPAPSVPALPPPPAVPAVPPAGRCLDVRIGAAGLHVCLDPPVRSP